MCLNLCSNICGEGFIVVMNTLYAECNVNNKAKIFRIEILFCTLNPGDIACVAGVNGEREGEREKNAVLRARDEGTPATKTPIFSSPPTDFYVIQLS